MTRYCRYCGVTKPKEGEQESHVPIAHGMTSIGDGKSIWVGHIDSKMTQREKIEDMLKTIYYKGKDGKGYSDYEISGDVAQIEDWIIKGKIEELLRHGKFSLPDKPSDYENQRLINERLATLQASLKGKEV